MQKQEIARKKITDALREDILLRDRMAKADGMIGVDETKIKEKNIKLNNQLLAFETKMQGFAGGKIKSVQKELETIRRLQAAHKTLGNAYSDSYGKKYSVDLSFERNPFITYPVACFNDVNVAYKWLRFA